MQFFLQLMWKTDTFHNNNKKEPRNIKRVMNYNLRGLLVSGAVSLHSMFIHSPTWCPDRWPFYLTSWHERCNLLLYESCVTLPRRQDMPKYSRLQCDRSETLPVWLKQTCVCISRRGSILNSCKECAVRNHYMMMWCDVKWGWMGF